MKTVQQRLKMRVKLKRQKEGKGRGDQPVRRKRNPRSQRRSLVMKVLLGFLLLGYLR